MDDLDSQDDDKQMTYDLVRVRYHDDYTTVFIDCDELLAPKSIPSRSMNSTGHWVPQYHPSSSTANHNMSSLRALVGKHFNSATYKYGQEEIHYSTYAVSAMIPGGVVHIKNYWLDGDVV